MDNKNRGRIRTGQQGRMDDLAVLAFSVLCVLGIITVPQYVHFMEGAIVDSVLTLLFLTMVGGFIRVFVGSNS